MCLVITKYLVVLYSYSRFFHKIQPQDCIKAQDDRSVPENIEIFFSYEGDNDKSTSTPFSALQGHSTSFTKYERQGNYFGLA